MFRATSIAVQPLSRKNTWEVQPNPGPASICLTIARTEGLTTFSNVSWLYCPHVISFAFATVMFQSPIQLAHWVPTASFKSHFVPLLALKTEIQSLHTESKHILSFNWNCCMAIYQNTSYALSAMPHHDANQKRSGHRESSRILTTNLETTGVAIYSERGVENCDDDDTWKKALIKLSACQSIDTWFYSFLSTSAKER